MDKLDEAIVLIKEDIKKQYEQTNTSIGPNIHRCHRRSLSTETENAIAIFLSRLLRDFQFIIDPTIHTEGTVHRPDLLGVRDGKVVFMIEIKANMGWCRDAEKVIEKIVSDDCVFAKQKNLVCESSMEEKKENG